MRKILTIGLAVLLTVFLGGMSVIMSGSSPSYAFSGEGFNGPSIINADLESPSINIAYHETIAGADSYAWDRGDVNGLSVNADLESPTTSIAYFATPANCPAYAENEEAFRGPLVSLESGGVMRGTDDAITLVAMLCE